MLREYHIRDPKGSREFFITTSTRLWLALFGPIVVWRLAGTRAALLALASSLAVLLAVVAAVLVASVLPPRIQLGVIVAGVGLFLLVQSFAGIRLVKRSAFRRRWLVKRL
jgi:peptidoglycan/LPS O-acetylase OafA/YrhL